MILQCGVAHVVQQTTVPRDWEGMQHGMTLIAGTLDRGITRGMAGLRENSSLKLKAPFSKSHASTSKSFNVSFGFNFLTTICEARD